MNKFIWCIETERGVRYGFLKAQDGRDAREKLEQWIEDNGYKEVTKLAIKGLHSGDFQFDVLSCMKRG